MAKEDAGTIYEFDGRLLCPMQKSFLPDLKKWRNQQINVLRQFKPLTDFDQETWFQNLQNDPKQILFGIITYVDGTKETMFIGYCGITNIDLKNKRGEISFLVDSERASNEKLYREDFLAVLEMLSRYSFEELNLNKLFTETFAFREYHIKILEEFGFKREGTLRNHNFKKGQYFDSIIHSLLTSEWKKKGDSK
jgi:RimJ/RimL family protein N-acetyltransferase